MSRMQLRNRVADLCIGVRPSPPEQAGFSVPSHKRADDGADANARKLIRKRQSIERVIRVMAERIDDPLTNDAMAAVACFSPCHFNRLFRRMTGVPPLHFLYAMRLERAKRLLLTTEQSVTEICFEVGYNSLGTFVSRFSALVGLSPSVYRRVSRNLNASGLDSFWKAVENFSVPGAAGPAIRGRLVRPPGFGGSVLVGLFRRPIPEGAPAACALVRDGDWYALPLPVDGKWFVMAIGVPWSANAMQLLTLDCLPRGCSGSMQVRAGRVTGSTLVKLAPPSSLDPPVLACIPLLTTQQP